MIKGQIHAPVMLSESLVENKELFTVDSIFIKLRSIEPVSIVDEMKTKGEMRARGEVR